MNADYKDSVFQDSKVIKITLGWLVAGAFILVTSTAAVVTIVAEFKFNDLAFNQHVIDNKKMFDEHNLDMSHKLDDIIHNIELINAKIETKQDRIMMGMN